MGDKTIGPGFFGPLSELGNSYVDEGPDIQMDAQPDPLSAS